MRVMILAAARDKINRKKICFLFYVKKVLKYSEELSYKFNIKVQCLRFFKVQNFLNFQLSLLYSLINLRCI